VRGRAGGVEQGGGRREKGEGRKEKGEDFGSSIVNR